MQGSTPFLIATSLLLAGAANAGASAQAVTKVAQLPAEVVSVLEEMGPISDPGGPFNESDVVAAVDPVPGQRLVSGQAGPDVILLQVEKGGRGHSHALMRFVLVDGHWKLASLEHLSPGAPR